MSKLVVILYFEGLDGNYYGDGVNPIFETFADENRQRVIVDVAETIAIRCLESSRICENDFSVSIFSDGAFAQFEGAWIRESEPYYEYDEDSEFDSPLRPIYNEIIELTKEIKVEKIAERKERERIREMEREAQLQEAELEKLNRLAAKLGKIVV